MMPKHGDWTRIERDANGYVIDPEGEKEYTDIDEPAPTPHDILKEAFAAWIPALGLAWWDITIRYYDDPTEVVNRFHNNTGVLRATCTTDWRYGEACIDVNLTGFQEMTPEQIERTALHELCHILVNEMREGELHHEERVVTALTKAFFWAIDAARDRDDASSDS